ncbi:hypothetical protein V8C44DRAFT_333609 [Trichoderma aethiopicum]
MDGWAGAQLLRLSSLLMIQQLVVVVQGMGTAAARGGSSGDTLYRYHASTSVVCSAVLSIRFKAEAVDAEDPDDTHPCRGREGSTPRRTGYRAKGWGSVSVLVWPGLLRTRPSPPLPC